MTKLSVNLNRIALLRNSRNIDIPSVRRTARTCIDSGVEGITVHPRPDQRHIRPADVHDLADMLTDAQNVEFNIEGNPFGLGLLDLVRDVKPTQCTLVPDDPGQATSDHGWDCVAEGSRLAPVIEELKGLGIRVSLFMDAEPTLIERAAEIGADRVELYTEPYALAFREGETDTVLPVYVEAAQKAQSLGMDVNAGHDLNLDNIGPFLRTVPDILEVSIGHALIAEAIELGLRTTISEYLEILGRT